MGEFQFSRQDLGVALDLFFDGWQYCRVSDGEVSHEVFCTEYGSECRGLDPFHYYYDLSHACIALYFVHGTKL